MHVSQICKLAVILLSHNSIKIIKLQARRKLLCIKKYYVYPQEPGTGHNSSTTATNAAIATILAHNISYLKETTTKQMKEGGLPQDVEERKSTSFSILYWPERGDGLPLIPYVVVDLSA